MEGGAFCPHFVLSCSHIYKKRLEREESSRADLRTGVCGLSQVGPVRGRWMCRNIAAAHLPPPRQGPVLQVKKGQNSVFRAFNCAEAEGADLTPWR